MKTKNVIGALLIAVAQLGTVTAWAEEVLPTLSAEKMSEYKSAFGQAIQNSAAGNLGAPLPTDGAKPPHPGNHAGLSQATQTMRDNVSQNGQAGGPPPNPGRPGLPPGPQKGIPGLAKGDNLPPPGLGGPGQPGGPPPGSPPPAPPQHGRPPH